MNRKTILSVFIISLAIIIFARIDYSTDIFSPPRAAPKYTTESFGFDHLWTNDDTFIGGNIFLRPNGFIEIESSNLLLLTLQRKFFRYNGILRKKNLYTGEDDWEIDFDFTRVEGVINNTATVFVVTTIQTFCGNVWKPSCESIRVTAYDMNNSNEKWTQVYDGMLNIDWMEVDEEILELHGSANRGNHRATFRVDPYTGEMLWSSNPTLSLQEIIEKAKQQPEYFVPQEVTSPVISNIARCSKISYFVTADSVLWATAQESRSTVGMIDFFPKEYAISIFDAHVLCNNSVVVVYFADSLQIFTFRLLQDENS